MTTLYREACVSV